MTNLYFESPRTLTEARLLFFQHKVPQTALGGDVQLIALQLRAALTDRLSVIAIKDGFAMADHPLLDDGWPNVSAGLKYNLIANAQRQRLLSVGATYEIPIGSTRLQQGKGSGDFHMFITAGTQLGREWHWLASSGLRLPADRSDGTSLTYTSHHLDRRLFGNLYALGEVNWYHWLGSGDFAATTGLEGLDLLNLGSVGVAGNDIVTGAFGLKLKPSDGLELGVAWEAPLTKRRDIIDNRLTVDMILRY
jgi:hypothetical protein